MIVDHEALMRWAKKQAPLALLTERYGIFRPVRLEIIPEYQWVDESGVRYLTPTERIVARVYLSEPRQGDWDETTRPIAEWRLA